METYFDICDQLIDHICKHVCVHAAESSADAETENIGCIFRPTHGRSHRKSLPPFLHRKGPVLVLVPLLSGDDVFVFFTRVLLSMSDYQPIE